MKIDCARPTNIRHKRAPRHRLLTLSMTVYIKISTVPL